MIFDNLFDLAPGPSPLPHPTDEFSSQLMRLYLYFVRKSDGVVIFKHGTPSDGELLGLAQETISIWIKLGLALGLDNSQLDEINADQSKGIDKSYAMLRKWKESLGSEANYERLAAGLGHKAVKRRDLIDVYCRDKGEHKTCSVCSNFQ